MLTFPKRKLEQWWLAFVLVKATIKFHGFSAGVAAGKGNTSSKRAIVGSNPTSGTSIKK